MKKIKLVIFSIICFLSIGIVYALQNTDIKSINETFSMNQDGIFFKDFQFDSYESGNTEKIGFMGSVENKNTDTISLQINIQYYDSNKQEIGTDTIDFSVNGNTANYYKLHSLSTKLGLSAKDISYYRFSYQIKTGVVNYVQNQSIPDTNSKSTSTNTSNSLIKIAPSENSLYSSYEYVIDKYDINIKVNENNTFDITENITAYFNVDKHGIFRTIPLKNEIKRLDGTTSKNRVKITNISVSEHFTSYKEDGNYKIQIGDADKTLTGEKNYTIKYNYNIGKDPLKDIDEFYYNIIGDNWDTVIGNITFTITMPKDFDESKLGFSSGLTGSTSNDNITYNVDGKTINGEYNGILNKNEALTIRLELPDGYFVGAGFPIDPIDYVIYIIPVIFFLISAFFWFKYGRDDTVIETVEFYPPEGFNSLELGFLYKGKAEKEDVVSLLIYLANKGYIKITETEKKSLLVKHKGFKITKLKDYDGDNANEEQFLNGLFDNPRVYFKKLRKDENSSLHTNEVTDVDLHNCFYVTVDSILKSINSKENKNKIFETNSLSKLKIVIAMMIITWFIIAVKPIIEYSEIETLLFAVFFPGVGIPIMLWMIFGRKRSLYRRISGLIWSIIGFGGVAWTFMFLPALLQDSMYIMTYIIGILCIIGMYVCYKFIPKRTNYGNELLGKIKGFKTFLETAEKDKLESMVIQNPNYFYDILPFTYVLDVSDKWIKKFETISLQAPSWYDGTSEFSAASFGSFMTSTMASAQTAMTSSPSSSGSGGSSGGGSSGGGSGGGGGGSW